MSTEIPNPNHVQAVEKVGEEATVESAGEKIFLDMVNSTKLFSGPAATSGGWAIVEVDQNGRKVPNAVLMLAQNNLVMASWYDPAGLEDFVQNANVILAAVRNAMMASMPLIVAGQGQMEQAVQAKNEMDKKFGSQKQPIDWPPKNGKFSL